MRTQNFFPFILCFIVFTASVFGFENHSGTKHGSNKSTVESPKAGSIEKLQDGLTVADVFKQRKELKGKTVKVRGKVMKVLDGIMGKTWVHLQDGTGAQGTNDLVFTMTAPPPDVASVVVGKGKLTIDKDLGSGYFYEAIVEESQFAKE